MKLGLIRAIDYEEPYVLEPIGLLYLASYLKKYLNFEDVFIAEHRDSLIREKPDIVGISTYTPYLSHTIDITNAVKSSLGVPVIIGGPHLKVFPRLLPSGCDIGVIGEGEETMRELMELYIKEKNFSPETLRKIKGITFKEGQRQIFTEPRGLIEPLDKIPHPGRDLLKGLYLMPAIMTGRGCPYNCGFCVSPLIWEHHRMFSIEYVCNELTEIVKDERACSRIEIKDDLFAVSIKRVKPIRDFIVKEGLNKELSFFVNIRANTFTEEMCQLLKEMNSTRVFVGFESNSEKILKFYNKRQTTEDNQRVIDLAEKYDMSVVGSFIIGAPVETSEDIMETYDFIYRNRHVMASFTCSHLVPEPGTPVWKYLEPKLPKIRNEMDVLKLMYFRNYSEHLTEEELNNYYNKICSIKTGANENLNRGFTLAKELEKAGFENPLRI